MNFDIEPENNNLRIPVSIVDIGAAWGGLHSRWNNAWMNTSALLIDPQFDDDLCNTEQGNMDNVKIYYNKSLVWKKKEKLNFHIRNKKETSSILQPNWNILNKFPNPERYNETNNIVLQARTLDDLTKGKMIDFIKIDAQGANYEILRGGEETLENALSVEIEIDFLNIYKNEHSFHEIDMILHQKGFELWNLRNVYWRYGKEEITFGNGRIAWADALYFKKNDLIKLDSSRIFSYLSILLAYGYINDTENLLNTIEFNNSFKELLYIAIKEQKKHHNKKHWRSADEDIF